MDAKSQKVEECLIASAWVKPETEVFDSPQLFKLINRSAPYEFLNGVYRTRLEESAAGEIQGHYEFYRDNKISFRWYVFPHSIPAGLDQVLHKLNPTRVTELQGLYAETADSTLHVPAGVTVEQAGLHNLDDYATASNAGWSQAGEQAERIRKEMHADFSRGNLGYRGYLARYEGRPAATGMCRIVNGAGYFYGGSTSPELRSKGAYRGLVAHRIRLLQQEGIPLAFILARKATSAPICRSLGFKVACEVRSYDFNF
jgi:hypothetical protein